MTNARDVARGCKRKARFPTHAAADIRAGLYGQVVYLCPHCGGYHCTSGASRQRVERERAERALAELERKGVRGPMLETAVRNVAAMRARR